MNQQRNVLEAIEHMVNDCIEKGVRIEGCYIEIGAMANAEMLKQHAHYMGFDITHQTVCVEIGLPHGKFPLSVNNKPNQSNFIKLRRSNDHEIMGIFTYGTDPQTQDEQMNELKKALQEMAQFASNT